MNESMWKKISLKNCEKTVCGAASAYNLEKQPVGWPRVREKRNFLQGILKKYCPEILVI